MSSCQVLVTVHVTIYDSLNKAPECFSQSYKVKISCAVVAAVNTGIVLNSFCRKTETVVVDFHCFELFSSPLPPVKKNRFLRHILLGNFNFSQWLNHSLFSENSYFLSTRNSKGNSFIA